MIAKGVQYKDELYKSHTWIYSFVIISLTNKIDGSR